MEFGIIGLGKMGGSLALQAVEKGIRVVGLDRTPRQELAKNGVTVTTGLKEFIAELKPPRIIFLWIPAGPAVDELLKELGAVCAKGDIFVDGGNSHFRDSKVRHKQMKDKGFEFIDCGTSGGMSGARNGACFMIGGESAPVKMVEPILIKLAVPEGYIHAGAPGAGHFVKLIHNGIEFGMLQAIGEGVALLNKSEFKVDLAALFHNWAHGSVIRSWLIEFMEAGLREKKDLAGIDSFVEDTGEVNWLVQEALNLEVSIPVISQSIMGLFQSREKVNDTFRAIALMRHGFGGHPFGPDKGIREERKKGYVGLK